MCKGERERGRRLVSSKGKDGAQLASFTEEVALRHGAALPKTAWLHQRASAHISVVLPQLPCCGLCGLIEDPLPEEVQLHSAIPAPLDQLQAAKFCNSTMGLARQASSHASNSAACRCRIIVLPCYTSACICTNSGYCWRRVQSACSRRHARGDAVRPWCKRCAGGISNHGGWLKRLREQQPEVARVVHYGHNSGMMVDAPQTQGMACWSLTGGTSWGSLRHGGRIDHSRSRSVGAGNPLHGFPRGGLQPPSYLRCTAEARKRVNTPSAWEVTSW
jgi:hypothetical protein